MASKRRKSKRSIKSGLPPGSLVFVGDSIASTTVITTYRYSQETFTRATCTIDTIPDPPKNNEILWINVDGLHDIRVLETLGAKYSISQLTLEDILNTEQLSKLDIYDDHIFIVLKMLNWKNDTLQAEQVSIIVGSNYIISVQEGLEGDVFDPVRIQLQSPGSRIRGMKADYCAYALMDMIIDNYFIILEKVSDIVEGIEESVVTHPEPQAMHTLYDLRRKLVVVRRAVWPLREIIGTIYRKESSIITPPTQPYIKDLYDHIVQVIDAVEIFRDTVSSVFEMYMTSVSTKMNEIMKTLTIISTIFIPLTFLAGIYGMNFDVLPELHFKYSYFILIAVMIALGLGMMRYFKKKNWF